MGGKSILRGRRFKREGKGSVLGRRFKREGKSILRDRCLKIQWGEWCEWPDE